MDEWIDVRTMDRWMNGWMDGWMNGGMKERMDGCKNNG